MTDRTNLLGFTLPQLTEWVSAQGEKPFRAKQLFQWIHQRGVEDFDGMTDLAKSLREKLNLSAEVRAPAILSEHRSADGTVRPSRGWTIWNDSWRNASPRVRAGQLEIVSQVSAAHIVSPH